VTAIAVVQARLGSSRFPRKVLASLAGKPMLEVLLHRLSRATTLDGIVVAIPDDANDDELASAIEAWGWRVVRGSGDDVLDRYHSAITAVPADVVVRVTGDCPLIDPELVDAVVDELLRQPTLDYVALGTSYPDGADCEAFRSDALERAWIEAKLPSEREHVTPFIWTNPDRFSLKLLERTPSAADIRLTVDEPTDLDVVEGLVRLLGLDASIDRYVDVMQNHPEFDARRPYVTRNEGLWRSRQEDEVASIGQRNALTQSDSWLERARAVIPGATQTLSKGIDQFVAGVTPAFLASGSGCHVTDVDGNTYIDYPMALGPVILGHAYPRTVEAVTRQIQLGATFTLPHPLEVEVAELVVDTVPSAEMVRFGKNGSDVTTAAIRLARAVTGKEVVLACGYHGWHDWYVAQTPRNAGVPLALRAMIDTFPYNDVAALEDALKRHSGNVAAVILEQGPDDPRDDFLQRVCEVSRRAGAVVIFDEIVTGFRFAPGGAQEFYGVTPDLTCMGKAMANGLPLSAIAGRRDLMEAFDRVFFSGTFGGETLALAGALATIDEIREGAVIPHIWRVGERLRSGLRQIIDASGLDVELIGHPPRSALNFHVDGEVSMELRGLFLQETVRRGILFGGPIFITYAHTEADIDKTLEAVAESFDVLVGAVSDGRILDRLEGPPPGVVFRPIRA
jgi:glutamate-1-semialdehyde 2,1-aminomutase/spore coat polysaccharide biosynthesis protein SpsF